MNDFRYFCTKVRVDPVGEWEILFIEDIYKWGATPQKALDALSSACAQHRHPLFSTFLRDCPVSLYATSLLKGPPSEVRIKRSYRKAVIFANAMEEQVLQAEEELDSVRSKVVSTEEYALKMMSSMEPVSETETIDL